MPVARKARKEQTSRVNRECKIQAPLGLRKRMTSTRRLLILSLLAPTLISVASASKKDDEAAALLRQTSNLSNIRREGSPSFRLKANITVINDDGSTVEGTYTEFWVTNAQWRKEVVLGDFHRTQVALGRKSWTLDSSTVVPDRIAGLTGFFGWASLQQNLWKIDKFEDQKIDGIDARCFRTKPEIWGSSELCFDKTSGALLAKIDPVRVKDKTVDGTFLYRGYKTFGDRLVATLYQSFENEDLRLQAKLVELALRPELSENLFDPVPGGKESDHCSVQLQPPALIHSQEPGLPKGQDGVVALSLRVGTDGKPRDLRVAGSLDKVHDEAALEAVRLWRFRPASCEGQPFEVEIAVLVDFHAQAR